MKSFNSITLIGRLTKKPETKIEKENKKTNFVFAVSRPYTDGEGKHPADFFPIVAYNKLGQICDGYLDKGSLVLVKGRLQSRSYESGKETKWVTEIVAESVNILESSSKKKEKITEKKQRLRRELGMREQEKKLDEALNKWEKSLEEVSNTFGTVLSSQTKTLTVLDEIRREGF